MNRLGKNDQEKERTVYKKKVLGFGFIPEQSEHFFLVTVPKSQAQKAEVLISEHFRWKQPDKGEEIPISFNDENAQLKVILARRFWDEIAEEVKAYKKGQSKIKNLELMA